MDLSFPIPVGNIHPDRPASQLCQHQCRTFLNCVYKINLHCLLLNAGALAYMAQQKLPPVLLSGRKDKTIPMETKTQAGLEAWMESQGINSPRHRKIITEGALMGGLLAQGIPVNFSINSDDAGQFTVFDHALCRTHAERIINRLIALNDDHVNAVDAVREQLWQLYRDLKTYKLEPTATQAEAIKSRFQTMCSTKTVYATLNQALKRMGNIQHELLRVLDKPYLRSTTT